MRSFEIFTNVPTLKLRIAETLLLWSTALQHANLAFFLRGVDSQRLETV